MAFTLVASACSRGAPTDAAPEVPAAGTVGSPELPKGDATPLEWTEAGLSGEATIDELIATDQGFIAYQFRGEQQAWVSKGGIDWIEADLDFGTANEAELGEVAIGGPGYVALGSTSDDDEVLWTSADGFTWERHDLDLEQPELGVFASVGLEGLIAGRNGLVLLGRLDPRDEGPDEHRFVVWTSVDGSEWNLVVDPFGSGAYIGEILSTNGGFVASGYGGQGEGYWLSTDGRSWEKSPAGFLDDSGFPAEPGMVRWGNKILTVVNPEDGVRLWTSTDGRAWEQLPASPTLSRADEFEISVMEVAAGPLGILLLGTLQPPARPEPPLVVEKDGLIATFDPETGRVTVTDSSSGDVLLEAEFFDPDAMAINEDDSVTLFHPDTGEALTTVTEEEFEEARVKAYEAAGRDPNEPHRDPSIPVLWFSPDGERWTSVTIEEISGLRQLPTSVVVGSEAVILRWSVFSPFEGEGGFEEEGFEEDTEILPEVIWVGTPGDEG
jgi:hypothetical protein